MSLQALPAELLDNLCHHLLSNDLYSLSIVSFRFYHIVQRVLYRHIHLHSPARLGVVLALSQKPHLAHYVKSFTVRLSPYVPMLHAFYRELANALANMSQLTSLELFLNPEASWILNTNQGTTYPRLRHLSSSFHLDGHVASFLNKTESLLELELDSLRLPPSTSTPLLHPDALPHLSQITGSSHVAQYLVPGRPIESIHLNSGDLTEDVAESLAKSTAPILVLIAATSSHSVSLLGTLTRFMENLVHLRIVSTYNFVDAPETSYFTNIANALTSLPDLISCEIWGMHWVSSKKALDDEGKVWQSESFSNQGSIFDDFYSEFYYA